MVVKVILCRWVTGRKITIDLCDTEEQLESITVLQLMEKIRLTEGVPDDLQRLIFSGRQLEGDRLLSEYGIQHMSVVYFGLRLQGGGPERGDGGRMGDKEGKNRSMEMVFLF